RTTSRDIRCGTTDWRRMGSGPRRSACERVAETVGRGEALVRRLGEGHEHDALEPGRHQRGHAPRRWWIGPHVLEGESQLVVGLEGRTPADHLVEHHAE